jgi:hypothetical protein
VDADLVIRAIGLEPFSAEIELEPVDLDAFHELVEDASIEDFWHAIDGAREALRIFRGFQLMPNQLDNAKRDRQAEEDLLVASVAPCALQFDYPIALLNQAMSELLEGTITT